MLTGKYHQSGGFSMAMLVYQRITPLSRVITTVTHVEQVENAS